MAKASELGKDEERFAETLLSWYDRSARRLPWRVPPGEGVRQDPYLVLISETMLQQTTVATVKGRFGAFIETFPSVEALASAKEEEVLAAWAGLGYYRRARSLHACAKAVAEVHGGVFPADEGSLRKLPGIGAYTAAAITSIAFGQRAVVVDTNVERIVARVRRITEPLPKARKLIAGEAEKLMPEDRYGDYAQALMDHGATICRPKAPDCLLCPVRPFCASAGTEDAVRLPIKPPKKTRKQVEGVMGVVTLPSGEIVAEDRPGKGLFAGMLGLPGGGWDGREVPSWLEGFEEAGAVRHVLTHRELNITVITGKVSELPAGYRAVSVEGARNSMPTLFVKALGSGI
ncbi:A/G-specific adenine glycosylase [Parvularcula maris]|uniref:Adenine DNA glycosylase n=1 Tax=Parvularcula maris TaxID=2965077 RepID=A0A9X2LBQ5_9PROT|nr:A/G-specific adenine glycosylase [Parvularcula maris]MCQ8185617.1 A/G-specific adenine glycosylase [Parvularcula maris]